MPNKRKAARQEKRFQKRKAKALKPRKSDNISSGRIFGSSWVKHTDKHGNPITINSKGRRVKNKKRK